MSSIHEIPWGISKWIGRMLISTKKKEEIKEDVDSLETENLYINVGVYMCLSMHLCTHCT